MTSKASLSEGTEYNINLTLKTVTVNVAGNISSGAANGVNGLALVSSIHDYWKSNANANKYEFPFFIVDGPLGTMLEMRNGWEFAGTSSIALIRSMGFAYKNTSEVITAEYACFVQAGSIENATDQPYYLLSSDTTPTNFGVPDVFNECIKIYGDATHGNIDKRSAAKFYIRDAGDTYAFYDLVVSQSLSALTYTRYLVPMTTVADNSLVVIGPSGAPYSGMTLTLGATTNTINSTVYNFAEGEINANSGTVQQVYDWFQNLLLQTTDIDSGAGTQRGDIYGGASLVLLSGVLTTSQGLTIKNIASADVSNIVHTDDLGIGRQELFVPTITVNCVDSSGASTNFTTGTRIQLYNSGGASASSWAALTAYTVGTKVLRTTGVGTESGAGLWMECTTSGTSGATEPTWSTTVGVTTSDGTVVWTTRAIEIYNAQPGAVSNIGVQYESGARADSTIRVRVIAVNGSTSAEKWIQTTLTATTTNVAVSVTQESNTVYVANGVDGSLVTECSISTNGIDIFVDDPDNTTTGQRIYNWYINYLASSAGIRDSNDYISATDQTHYVYDLTLQIRNLDTVNPLNILGANIVPASGDATDIFDLSNGASIALNFNRVEGFAFSSGSGLSPTEHTWLESINNVTASNLDSPVSGALTTGKFLATK